MVFLWIAISVQKVVLLDDLGLLEPKGSLDRSALEGLLHSSSSGPNKSPESTSDGSRSAPNSRVSSLQQEHTSLNDSRARNIHGLDISQAIQQYLAREKAQSSGAGSKLTQVRGMSTANESSPADSASGKHAGREAGSWDGKTYGRAPGPEASSNAGSVDIDVPYRSQEASHKNDPEHYYRSHRGIETGARRWDSYRPGSGHYGHQEARGEGDPKDSFHSILHGAEDTENANDFERNARENIENAKSAQESYLEVKVRESRGRENKIAEELGRVDGQMEILLNSLSETRMRAQKTQIDLLNRRNSVKNLLARRDSSEKTARKLNAEMRILNNEVVRLSRELDDKRNRLENLGEDISMQSNRVRGIDDEIMSRNNEVDQDEAKKNDLNKDVIRIENAIAKLKEDRDSLMREKSREGRVQARLQREIDKIGEAGIFV